MAEPVLSHEEANQVIQLLSQLDVFTADSRSRRDFVDAAGLGKYAAGIDWGGPFPAVASSLVASLNTAGLLKENPYYQAIGKLLVYILSWPAVRLEDARAMAALIVRRSLVRDPGYLESLCERYQITDLPAESQLPAVHFAAAPPPFTVTPRIKERAALEQELVQRESYLEINLLAGAIYCAQAVGRVEAPENNVLGTGWLIAPNMLLTNFHVLKTREYAEEGVVRFGHCLDPYGVQVPGECAVKIDPSFYYTSLVEALDYALVRLAEKPLESRMLLGGVGSLSMLDLLKRDKHRGYLVARRQNSIERMPINLIQYLGCADLKAILTQSLVASAADHDRIHYFADITPGSSGAPVFNRFWEVVAMHHSAGPSPTGEDTAQEIRGRRTPLNEGIPMKAILADFRRRTIDNTSIPLIALIPEGK